MHETLPTARARRRAGRLLLTLALGLLGLTASPAQQRLTAPPADPRQPVPAMSQRAAAPFTPSPAAAANQRLTAAISSTATGGNWSSPATWAGGTVPTAADDVTIVNGATVTLDVAALAGSLTINAGGTLVTSPTTANSLQVGGNVTNNGTLTMSASATLGSDLRFVAAGSVTFTGTGTTDLFTLSLAKSVQADVVDLNLPTLSVRGTANSPTGFLSTRTTNNTVDDMVGTLRISGTATLSNRVFGNAAAYVIPATGGFWLNNPNFTVGAQTGSPTVNGLLRLSAGTFNVGTSSGNSILFGTNSVLTVDGGTLNAAGRVGNFTGASSVTGSMTFTLSSGTINVATVGNASGTPSFGVNGTSNVSGGAINLVQRSTATTPLDYYVAGTYNFTSGTLNVGTAATATNFDFRIRGNVPNLNLDNTTAAKSALLVGQTNSFGTVTVNPGTTLNLNGALLLQIGPTFTNNGTLTGSAAGSTLYFGGTGAQTYGGTGTAGLVRTLSIDNSSAGGVTLAAPLTVYRVNMFTGNLAGTSNLTIGDGTLVLFVVQIGVANNTGTSGSFASAPTFNIGAGAYLLLYAQETTNRTTGLEVPPSRVVDGVTISNSNGVTLAGGPLTINTSGVSTNTLTLTSGVFTTSAANPVIIGTGATTFPTGSATSYVRGPLGITVNSATAVSRTFAVGDAAGWRPVVVGSITTSSAQTFTATVVSGATGGTLSGALSSLNPTRYVRLQNTAALPASATVQLSYGADDVIGAPATAVVAQAATAAGAYASIGGAAATVPTTGIVSTQPLTPGNDFFVLANGEGGTLATSTATGCAGSTSGTLTLSGNAAGSTVVKYQANTGSGFVDVPGTNTGPTYAFSNLTTTTTFQAVLTTSDGRTVTSAPVTVTVNPVAVSTFSYGSGPFCVSGATNPSVTLSSGATAGTFTATPAGLSLNATTGAITLGSSTPGTYTVTNTVSGTCGSSSTATVVINAAPTAGFSYGAGPFCVSGATNPSVTLSSGATAGTFTATPAGLTLDPTTGAITLSSSTPGTYTVTNTVAAANGCAAVTSTATVVINAAPTAGFSYPATLACVGTATTLTPTLSAGATAGTFSLPAAPGLSLDPTTGTVTVGPTAAAGTYTVTNTVATSGGCAAVTSTASFTLTAPASAAFSYGGSPFCASGSTNPTPTITGAPGGTFSSTTGLSLSATTGAITLSTSTPGTYVVTYTVPTTATQCGSSSTQTVVINAPATAGFSYGAGPFCVSGATNPTVTLASGATAGTFSSTAGLTLNATTGAITLGSSTPGTYTVTNTVAASGGCAAVTSTATVTITAAPLATFSYGAGASGCAGSIGTAAPTLSSGATAGTFTATPAGLSLDATTGVITLATSAAGTYTVTNTVAATGGCAPVTATATFTVNPTPATPTLTATGTSATGITLTSSAATGNQFFRNGVAISGATGQTFLVNSGTLNGSYTVVVTNASGCSSAPSAAVNVVVTSTSAGRALGSGLALYPNPTPTGRVTLELTGYRLATELTVLDALGRTVLTRQLPAGTSTQQLDLSGAASGLYVLRLRNADGVETHRLTRE